MAKTKEIIKEKTPGLRFTTPGKLLIPFEILRLARRNVVKPGVGLLLPRTGAQRIVRGPWWAGGKRAGKSIFWRWHAHHRIGRIAFNAKHPNNHVVTLPKEVWQIFVCIARGVAINGRNPSAKARHLPVDIRLVEAGRARRSAVRGRVRSTNAMRAGNERKRE